MESTIRALRRVYAFGGLSNEVLARIARVTVKRLYAPGEIILLEGEPCEEAYFITEGQVRIYRLSVEGREQVLLQLEAGQVFNLVPWFQGYDTCRATAEAVSSVTLYTIAYKRFEYQLKTHPDLALSILRDFAGRLAHLTDLVADLSLRTVRGRLVRFLLEHAEEDKVTRGWTQQEIATHVGTVRDIVGRTLRALADDGLVRIERQRIILLDRAGLEEEIPY
jgi:CRP/FNR family transcriptional regulator